MEDLLPFALLCFTSFFTRYDAGFLDHDQWHE